jgi:hypothetical protein
MPPIEASGISDSDVSEVRDISETLRTAVIAVQHDPQLETNSNGFGNIIKFNLNTQTHSNKFGIEQNATN